ncbi:MAG: sugar phosphate nucleotidyltransferase, partial [Anaerolineaceae bacterium]
REYLHGPMIMIFADTLMETEFSFLKDEKLDVVAWVKAVPDPRRFGVAEVNSAGRVTRLIENPQSVENNLAVIGVYYFRDSEALVAAIEEQMRQNISLKGEFFLADAINILLKRGASMRVQPVDVWLDAGTPAALLDTNRYLLEHGYDNSAQIKQTDGTAIIPPVFIHPDAHIEGSVSGPHASIGPGCRVVHSVVRNSILEDNVELEDVVLEESILGCNAAVQGQVTRMNVGDQSWVKK